MSWPNSRSGTRTSSREPPSTSSATRPTCPSLHRCTTTTRTSPGDRSRAGCVTSTPTSPLPRPPVGCAGCCVRAITTPSASTTTTPLAWTRSCSSRCCMTSWVGISPCPAVSRDDAARDRRPPYPFHRRSGSSMRPQFTIVSAIYNVSEYIDAFLASLDRQTYGLDKLEVILVDDGSTDDSGEIAERWAQSSRAHVRVLHQENAGQGAARNNGIELATGEWVTFADPDDVLSDTYLTEVAAFLAAQEQTPDLLATRQLIFSTDPAVHTDRHPLRRRFEKSQLVDLSRFPDHIQLSGCSAFFPLDRLKQSGLRFDTRIRPTFEDGHFIGVHLLESPAPLVGFIRTAEYYYR